MPARQKHPLQEADPNAETRATSTGTGSKKQKQKENQAPSDKDTGAKDAKASKNTEHEHEDETPMDELPPHEYILMYRPMYDFRKEAEEALEEEGEDYEDEDEQYERLSAEFKKASDAIKFGALASTQPDHKWICMRGTWVQFADAVRLASYRNPDAFGMYIYNDFEAYGMHEMVENFMVRYNKEFSKKEADQSLQEMWRTLSALFHWMNHDGSFALFGRIDDGERVEECWQLVASAFLSMLNSLERSKQVDPDSSIKDLALVMALFLNLRGYWGDFDFTFHLDVLRFAREHNIDLASSGVSGLKKYLKEQEKNVTGHKKSPKAAPDRWGFKKAFRTHTQQYGKGGHRFDITKMSRAERKSHAFDKKDPLAGFTDKQIRDGGLMFA